MAWRRAAADSAAATPESPRSSSCNPPSAASSYSASSYWDDRYGQRAPTHFDWFFSHRALRALLADAATLPGERALHVGCGNSDLSIGIGEDGTPVVNVDVSPVVIAQMRDAAASWPDGPARRNCSFAVADCRAMPQYEDASFGAVIDKGTLDAVLCSGTGLCDARSYVMEANRLLAPGGVFLLISLGQPDTRLSVLRAQPATQQRPHSSDGSMAAGRGAPSAVASRTEAALLVAMAGFGGSGRRFAGWSRVGVYLLPKPTLYLQGEASLLGRTPPVGPSAAAGAPAAVGKDDSVAWLGPFGVGAELDAALAAPGVDPRSFFYAYACVKAGDSVDGPARRALQCGLEGATAGIGGVEAAPAVARALSLAAALAHSVPAVSLAAGAPLPPEDTL